LKLEEKIEYIIVGMGIGIMLGYYLGIVSESVLAKVILHG